MMQAISLVHGETTLLGQLAMPEGDGPRPVVLVFPSALGLGDHALNAARRLADAGYLALGVDMYGDGVYSGYEGAEEVGSHYETLLMSPQLLRDRALAWLERGRTLPHADPERIAAIGYCFGGLCVLELARTGADLKAVVSFHGILTTQLPAPAGSIKAEIVAYCGGKDPYAPVATIDSLRAELDAAGARYQITTFGNTEHSFTDPAADRVGRPGISYDLAADRISWAGTAALLDTIMR